MAYLSLYRKYRSANFGEIIGQEHITTTLANAINKKRIAHAYLFSGPRGTGKTSTARIFAKSLNCVEGPTPHPCDKCDICVGIGNDSLFDVIEIDAASNRGIDDIRDLREKVRVPPSQARYKIYIIDEVHMLTSEAFNALLKTLEEPPSYVVFMMATTEPQKLLSTILSRCQRFDFGRLSDEEIRGHIRAIATKEDFTIDDEALSIVVKSADGSMRDSISILDQLISFSGGNITAAEVNQVFGLVERREISLFMNAVFDGDLTAAFNLFNTFFEAGKSFSMFIRYLMEYVCDLYLVKQNVKPLKDIYSKPELKEMTLRARSLSRRTLVEILEEMARVEDRIRWETYPRIVLEVMVVRLLDKVSGPGLAADPDAPAVAAPAAKTIAPPPAEKKAPRAEVPAKPVHAPQAAEPKIVEEIPDPVDYPPVEDAVPVPPPNASASLVEFYNSWNRILDDVKKSNVPTYFNMANGKPALYENGMLVLEFDREHRFHMEMASEEKNLRVLVKSIKNVLGADCIARCRMASDPDEAPEPAPSQPEKSPEEIAEEKAPQISATLPPLPTLPEEIKEPEPAAAAAPEKQEILENEAPAKKTGQASLFDAFMEVFPQGQEID